MSGDTFEFTQGARDTLRGTLHDPGAATGDVLTVQADGSVAAQPGSGGGVQVVTVPVGSAEVLAGTKVEIVAAVPGSMIVPFAAILECVPGVTPYTDHGGSVAVSWGDGAGSGQDFYSVVTAGFIDQAASSVWTGVGGSFTGPGNPLITANLSGANIQARITAPLPTGGDGTLTVTLFYSLCPLTP